uniref:Proline rich transmembrane protein 4 n=1 Tax=Pelusios castaneus TaxID=367368 RepID=A0A8C8RFN9_9SAUR
MLSSGGPPPAPPCALRAEPCWVGEVAGKTPWWQSAPPSFPPELTRAQPAKSPPAARSCARSVRSAPDPWIRGYLLSSFISRTESPWLSAFQPLAGPASASEGRRGGGGGETGGAGIGCVHLLALRVLMHPWPCLELSWALFTLRQPPQWAPGQVQCAPAHTGVCTCVVRVTRPGVGCGCPPSDGWPWRPMEGHSQYSCPSAGSASASANGLSSPSPSSPGPVPGRHGPSAGSEGALAAWLRCSPEKPEECGSPSPEPEAPPASHLLPSPPLFVTLHADWNTAMADWGAAWEAHVYGAGSLFSLLALLSLLGLACLPFRCPAGSTFLVALDLLLLGAGGARAFLLFYDAYGQQERLPAFASLLLHDLPFPCLSSALAVACLLLSGRSRLKLSRARCRHPSLLAALVLLHFFVAVGAILAVELLRQFPFLLLASRGAFALLAALLSLAFLGFYCQGQAEALQVYDLKSSTEPQGRCAFADARDWRRAAHTVLLAACFALLSAGLQAYAILHALGYGLPPGFFGPWPWWSLQLGCRLCEVGTGLPLALVGLYPVFCSQEEPCPHCWSVLSRLPPAHVPMKGPLLPSHFQWAVSQHEKLVICDTIARSDSEFLPLYALAESHLSAAEDVGLGYCGGRSPGAPGALETHLTGAHGSRPPSPINLRRSIDEALFSEALIPTSLFQPGEMPAGCGLSRTSSCSEMDMALPEGRDRDMSPDASRPDITLSSLGRWRGSSSGSPDKLSLDGSSQALCSSPENAPAPSSFASEQKLPHSLGENSPLADGSAGLQEEFVDVCQQIDTLSVTSDTIDL